MLEVLHFVEACAPDEESFEHFIVFERSEDVGGMSKEDICEEIADVKADMDCLCEGNPEAEKLYRKYCDMGWHEKIDAAFDIVALKNLELGLSRVSLATPFTYEIN